MFKEKENWIKYFLLQVQQYTSTVENYLLSTYFKEKKSLLKPV